MAYQILNPGFIKKYKPSQYHREGAAYVLNPGVKPISGTVKDVGTPSIKSLQLESGNPNAVANLNRSLSGGIAENSLDQAKLFGTGIMGLLKQYQGMEKFPFAEQGLKAKEEQVRRMSAPVSPELAGAAPSIQSGARSASVSAVQPTVSGASEAGQTFASRLSTFADIVKEARNLQAQAETSAQQAKVDAQNLITTSFANIGADAFSNLDPTEITKIEKLAGFPSGYIKQVAKTIKAREAAALKAQAPQVMETSQGIMQWNPTTGRWENTGMRPKPTGGGSPKALQFSFNPETGEPYIFDPNTGMVANIGQQGGTNISFDDFVKQKEQEAGQSFSKTRREQLKSEYQSTIGTQKLTKSQRATVDSIAGDVRQDTDIKDFVTIRDAYDKIKIGAQSQPGGPGDITLIFGYMKLVDPTSVVREGEFATAANAGGIPETIRNTYNKILKGSKISQKIRNDYLNQAQQIYNTKKKSYDRAVDFYKDRAIRSGVDPSLVLRDFTSTLQSSNMSMKSGTTSSGLKYTIE